MLWLLWTFYATRAQHDIALDCVREMLERAERDGKSDYLVVAHNAASLSYFWVGDYRKAETHLEAIEALYDYDSHKHLVWQYNHDPKVTALIWATHWYWMLGRPDRAAEAAHEHLELSRRLGHPFNLIFSLTPGSCAFMYRREPDRQKLWIDEALRIGEEQSFPIVADFCAPMFSGISRIEAGEVEFGRSWIEQSGQFWGGLGAGLLFPMHSIGLAMADLRLGEIERGLEVIDEAIERIQRTGEGMHEAEAYRIKGELCRATGADRATDAEACFRTALETARRQDAKGWELRSATSLARLWQSQGKVQEARDLLFPVYDWFTEGFDTADLMDAKALLDELK